MLTKRIIPCLDIDKGRVVKGVNFVDIRDAGDPATLADFYDDEGADELVFLDITASSDNRGIMIDVVRQVSEQVFIPLTVGGGIRSVKDVRRMLEAGADKVSLNTAAVLDPHLIETVSRYFGNQCIVIAVDVKKVVGHVKKTEKEVSSSLTLNGNSKWEVYTHGGRTPTGIDAIRWVKWVSDSGAGELLITSMDADGQKTGYDIELQKTISETVKVPVIASGGAGKCEHFLSVFNEGKADAALAASIFHYGHLRIDEVKRYLDEKGVPVRLNQDSP